MFRETLKNGVPWNTGEWRSVGRWEIVFVKFLFTPSGNEHINE